MAPPEAEFPFSVECKVYKSVEIYKALYAKSNIFEWWAQCVEDTPKGLHPMLIMRENMKKHLLAISAKTYVMLMANPKLDRQLSFLPHFRLRFLHEDTWSTIVVFEMQGFLDATAKLRKSMRLALARPSLPKL